MVHCGERTELQCLPGETRDGPDRRYANVVRRNENFVHPWCLLNDLSSGSWKTATFKKYNFEADGTPVNGGAFHPLLKVREEFRNIFLEMG